MEDLNLFFRVLMAANSVTLWMAGRIEGHRSATAASVVLLAGAAGWADSWPATIIVGYWFLLGLALAWVGHDGLRALGWVGHRRRR